MTYREQIYKACDSTDLDNNDEVIGLIQFLAGEAVQNHEVLLALENKLKEVVSAKEFDEFIKKTAKEQTLKWVGDMSDELLAFVLDNEEDIFGDIDDEY